MPEADYIRTDGPGEPAATSHVQRRPDPGARARASVARYALFAFAASRALVASAVLLALHAGAQGTSAALVRVLFHGDAGWYLGIAQGGYDPGPFSAYVQHNWAFFPVLPLLVRGAAAVTGEYAVTGALLCTACFGAGLVVLGRLALSLGFSIETARRTVLYTALWSNSIFFSVATTEALFLALTAGCLLAALRGRFWLAGVAGAIATATRPNGVALLAPLLVLWWTRPDRSRRQLLALAIVPLGLAAFMVYLGFRTGDPLAFSHIQVRWARYPGFFLSPLWEYVRHPLPLAKPWDFRLLNFVAGVAGLWAAVHWARRRAWALAAYTAVAMLMPLSTHSLQSLSRFAMVVVPVPLALADGLPRWASRLLLGCLVATSILVTVLFARDVTFAVT